MASYNIVYPASNDFTNSPPKGAADAVAHMTQRAAACPGTKFALGGWSQGAMVVHDISSSISAGLKAKIVAIAVFGKSSLVPPFHMTPPVVYTFY